MVKNSEADVTAAGPAETLVGMLDAIDTMPAAAALRARSYELLGTGSPIADVGCGPGRAVAELNERGRRAIGVDMNPEMIAIARRRWPDADFRTGDAGALPFEDGEVAGYRAEKVFHEIGDPARALEEARRVLTPGGHVVLIGQDWDALVIDSADPALTRTIVHARADLVPSPRAARGYRNLLRDAGFEDVHAEAHIGVFTGELMLPLLAGLARAVHESGVITRKQRDAWIAEQADRARFDRLFLAFPVFLAFGRRP
ncbi:methyltransferase domain-containing protein [Planotetraspora mira]|uniref:Methyltransferase n=1 Tax=Planotetraspora mira TaxID=58121 RepID=A0A8J3TWH1_9ACTN|nr:methyltransferase domain-containing protein [Planotetraspora mira]GII33761.1 methyltransferase [Planotetraspora mira]